MNKELNVLSLFNGLGCAWLALDKAGFKVNKRYVSEIDKYANLVNDANYPDSIQLGDVRNVNGKDLGHIDMICGGSPCQSFSFAGKRKGMSTTDSVEILTLEHYLELKSQNFEFEGQSYLFWEYMRILTELREVNPNINFFLENVEMGEKWQNILTKAIGINPIKINSALVSAQNRKRVYWTNIGAEPDGFFGDLVCKIPQPKDKGILLKDILETEVAEKYYLSDKAVDGIFKHKEKEKEKGNGFGAKLHEENNKMSALKIGGKGIDDLVITKIDKQGNIKSNQDKASCFTAGGHSGGNHSDMDLIRVHNTMPRSSTSGKGGTGPLSRTDGKTYCLDTGNTNAVEIPFCVAMRGRNPENPKSRVAGLATEQQLEPRTDGKTNCLTSVQKDNLVIQINPSKESGGKQPFQQNRVYDTEGISPALSTDSRCPAILEQKGNFIFTPGDYRTGEGFRARKNGKAPTLTVGSKNSGTQLNSLIMITPITPNKKETLVQIGNIYNNEHNSVAGRVYTDEGKSVTLSAMGGGGGAKTGLYKMDSRIRRLTPTECERLQTIPDNFTAHVSDSQRYKMIGNSWTCDVISHIFSYLK